MVCVLVAQQLLDLYTTWLLIFKMNVAEEGNPILSGLVNGANGLWWLLGIKLSAAVLVGLVSWLSLAPQRAKKFYWVPWNLIAYAYTALIIWNTSLIVYATFR